MDSKGQNHGDYRPIEPASGGHLGKAVLLVVLALALLLALWTFRQGAVDVGTSERVVDSGSIVDIERGSVTCWLRFSDTGRRDHAVFHTDDSRIVLYIDTYSSRGRTITRIAARAGGNRRAVDSAFRGGNFPEASIIIDNDGSLADYGATTPWYSPTPFPVGEWHHVAMTWDGYPEGLVRIYLDGKLRGEKPYDSRYDDGRPVFQTFSVGHRPAEWLGEIVNDGERIVELVPMTPMSVGEGGISIRKLEVHPRAVTAAELLVLANLDTDALFAK